MIACGRSARGSSRATPRSARRGRRPGADMPRRSGRCGSHQRMVHAELGLLAGSFDRAWLRDRSSRRAFRSIDASREKSASWFLPPSSVGGSFGLALGVKLFIDAQASISMPSTPKNGPSSKAASREAALRPRSGTSRRHRLQAAGRGSWRIPNGLHSTRDNLSPGGGRHHFLQRCPSRPPLSSIASARSFFNLAFSASSAFSRLASDTSSPPNFAF